MSDARVPVLEVFSTFQGEGPFVGARQIFVRLAKCDLRCAFCDTPESYPTPDTARIQIDPGGERDDHPENPVAIDELIRLVLRLDEPAGVHAGISITGGEPLLHPHAVHALGEAAQQRRLNVHVETGGHRPGAVSHVLPVVDWISPDLKLESATGAPTPWDAHRETYELLEHSGKGLAIKMVVGATSPMEEIEHAAAFCAEHAPNVTLVLQPVTPHGEGPATPATSQLFRMHARASAVHPDVRVIPQVHRLLGLR